MGSSGLDKTIKFMYPLQQHVKDVTSQEVFFFIHVFGKVCGAIRVLREEKKNNSKIWRFDSLGENWSLYLVPGTLT